MRTNLSIQILNLKNELDIDVNFSIFATLFAKKGGLPRSLPDKRVLAQHALLCAVEGYLFGAAHGYHFTPQRHGLGLARRAILRCAGLKQPVKFRGTAHPDGAVGFFVLFHKLRKAVPHAEFAGRQGNRLACPWQFDEELNIEMIAALGAASTRRHAPAHDCGGCAVTPDAICRRPIANHVAVKLRQGVTRNQKI